MKTRLILLLPAFAAGAGWLFANGGPVDGSDVTLSGNPVFVQHRKIRLDRENLTLRLEKDRRSYTATAVYEMFNEGGVSGTGFSIPLVRDQEVMQEAKAVRLRLNGQEKKCRVEKVKPADSSNGNDPILYGWCVTALSLKPGANEIRLEYRGQLIFTDWATSKSALTHFDDRRLYYPLYPAGYWKGAVQQLDIRFYPGPFAPEDVEIKSPAGAKKSVEAGETIYKWELSRVDLKKLEAVRVSMKPAVERNKSLLRAGRPATRRKASSILEDKQALYGPQNVGDGRTDTAWCVGTQADGIEEWIELSGGDFDRIGAPLGLEGIVIVPGLARNEQLYRENSRVKKIRIASCGQSGGKTITLPVADRADRSALFLKFEDFGSALQTKGPQATCVRITIVETMPGTKFNDVCFSEIRPVYNGGE